MKETGIKRRPLVAGLLSDCANSFPYDTMHLCFSGLVSITTRLTFGMHDKLWAGSSFVLPISDIKRINRSLTDCGSGFPTDWDRFPVSLDNFSTFKAETLKTFALYYAVPIISKSSCNHDMLELWSKLHKVLFIVLDPTPLSNSPDILTSLVQKLHALYTKTSFVDEYHSYVFTPTSHAFLYLPEILRENGPLLNVSQFLADRIIGDLVRYSLAPSLLETNLLNAFLYRFGTRMLVGGVHQSVGTLYESSGSKPDSKAIGESQEDLDTDSQETDTANDEDTLSTSTLANVRPKWGDDSMWTFKRSRSYILPGNIPKDLIRCVHASISPNVRFSIIKWVKSYERAALENDHRGFAFEIYSRFQRRNRQQSRKGFMARQSHWIAANYSSDSDETLTDTYYGSVLGLHEVEICVENPSGMDEEFTTLKLVLLEWQKGLHLNRRNETVYTKLHSRLRKGSLLDKYKTFENISCVDRKIGYFDHGGLRFFLDDLQRRVFGDESVIIRGCI